MAGSWHHYNGLAVYACLAMHHRLCTAKLIMPGTRPTSTFSIGYWIFDIRYSTFLYLAYATARFSRITVTLI